MTNCTATPASPLPLLWLPWRRSSRRKSHHTSLCTALSSICACPWIVVKRSIDNGSGSGITLESPTPNNWPRNLVCRRQVLGQPPSGLRYAEGEQHRQAKRLCLVFCFRSVSRRFGLSTVAILSDDSAAKASWSSPDSKQSWLRRTKRRYLRGTEHSSIYSSSMQELFGF